MVREIILILICFWWSNCYFYFRNHFVKKSMQFT